MATTLDGQRRDAAGELPLAAALWLIADGLMFAAMNLLVRINVLDVDPKVALWLRYAFGIPIAWISMRVLESRATHREVVAKIPILQWRLLACAGSALISNAAWYEAISRVSLSVATTVFYTKGFFLILLGALLLSERIRAHHVCACAIGFGGVTLITGVDGSVLRAGVLLVLLSALASAAMILQIRYLSRHMQPLRLTLTLLLLGAPVSFCLALPSWTWPSPTVLACFGIVALLSVGIHVAIANGYRSGALASLVPFDFLRLIFMLLLEFIVLGLDVPVLAWVGVAIVLLALVLNTVLDRRHAALRRDTDLVGADAGKSTPPIGP